MRASTSSIAYQLKTIMFCECDDFALRELGTKQVRQILSASVAVQMYELKDKRIVFVLLQLFQGNQCPLKYKRALCTGNALCRLPKND